MRRTSIHPLPTLLSLSLLAGSAFGTPALQAAPAGAWQRAQRGQALPSCLAAARHAPLFWRESQGANGRIDACGVRTSSAAKVVPLRAGTEKITASPLSIDRMITTFSGSHAAGGAIGLVGHADTYELSDGSTWTSGAGSYFLYSAQLDHVEVAGSTIRYFLVPPPAGSIYEQTDFDAGDHSAQGRLAPSGALVLEAQAGSATAVLQGNALLASNDPTSFGDRFHYYSAVPGAVVPFEMTFTMTDGTWGPDSFDQAFSYSIAGFVDFENPVSSPSLSTLRIEGAPQIPDDFAARYRATVRYDNGVEREVGTRSSWTVDPPALATINGGLLTVGTVTPPEAALTLQATFVQGAESLTANKVVRALTEVTAEKPGTWPMFQANARHTGYVEVPLQPVTFRLKWQRDLETGSALHPVAAGDGKVFVTRRVYEEEEPNVEALRASDGTTLWSRPLGSGITVNPPSYAYGAVYLQTDVEGGSGGWLRVLDGENGDPVFQEPFSKQSANYYAPTIFDGKAYVNGGFAGGMYGFEAYGAGQLWFTTLPQVDQWTPAVDATNAYAYLGGNAPGFYARNRATGAAAYFISDPTFVGGSNMNLAPVLGDQDDALVINNGRLLSYNTAAHNLRWQVAGQYAGQPSLAHGRIYALDAGRLRVLDEATHVEAWSFLPADGLLTGPVLVTDQYVFASTNSSVHAVDLTTHQSVWTFPVAGTLALADGALYVASADGKLSAFASPAGTALFTLTPCRVVDTRLSSGVPVGGPALAANVPRNLHIAGSCGVPTSAVAVVLNVTVTQAQASGFVQLDGTGQPGAYSTLNYPVNATRANLSFSQLSPTGDLTALASQANGTTVHLLVDVTGYFQ